MRPTFIRAFGYEVMISSTHYSDYNYFKDSATEREIQIGNTKIEISYTGESGFIIDRFSWCLTLQTQHYNNNVQAS